MAKRVVRVHTFSPLASETELEVVRHEAADPYDTRYNGDGAEFADFLLDTIPVGYIRAFLKQLSRSQFASEVMTDVLRPSLSCTKVVTYTGLTLWVWVL